MQKNRNRATPAPVQVRALRRFPVALPEVANIDVLAVVQDEELVTRLRSLEEDRIKVLDAHMDAKLWEEEVAFIRREMQIRRGRREAHERFSRALEQEYMSSEVGLPSADLDNSQFLRAIGELS